MTSATEFPLKIEESIKNHACIVFVRASIAVEKIEVAVDWIISKKAFVSALGFGTKLLKTSESWVPNAQLRRTLNKNNMWKLYKDDKKEVPTKMRVTNIHEKFILKKNK